MTLVLDKIAARLAAGESVAAIARREKVSPSAIYLALRRAGTPVRSLTGGGVDGVRYRSIKGLAGYRAGNDGTIQSCLSPRTGDHTKHWRTLSWQRGAGGGWCVSLGSSNSSARRRRGVRGLLRRVWGNVAGVAIFEAAVERNNR